MRRILITAVAIVLLVLGVAGMASATEEADCKTVTTQLVDRPDSAVGGGTWALDAMTRTAVVCQTAPGVYSGEVTDDGTFVTQALDHTPAGVAQPLPAGIEGTVAGGFTTVEFQAEPDWATFDASVLDGVTVTGADHPSGTWVSELFSDVDQATLNGDDWSWTYTTCSESWTNQADALGGNSGDITSVPDCPEPEPTPTPTSTSEPTIEPTIEPTKTPAAVPTAIPAGQELPKTGVSPALLGLGGLALLGAGGGLLVWRHRKPQGRYTA